MDRPAFVYVVYIRTTAEKVWHPLTDAETTRQYWSKHRNTSDWKIGSPWRHEDFSDSSVVDISGTVLESVQPKRLALTWAPPGDGDDGSRISRVGFDIVEDDGTVRLTLTHDQLSEGSPMAEGISEGWPLVPSSLKTPSSASTHCLNYGTATATNGPDSDSSDLSLVMQQALAVRARNLSVDT